MLQGFPEPLAAAYQQGYAAGQADRSRHTNPHGGAVWAAWDCGWQDAQGGEAEEEEDDR
jgi:ribosome modulation factor